MSLSILKRVRAGVERSIAWIIHVISYLQSMTFLTISYLQSMTFLTNGNTDGNSGWILQPILVFTHTHTHAHIYTKMGIYIEREREWEWEWVSEREKERERDKTWPIWRNCANNSKETLKKHNVLTSKVVGIEATKNKCFCNILRKSFLSVRW